MIIRELKDHPELIENFDWFNDYKDTRAWARRNSEYDIVEALDKGCEAYWDNLARVGMARTIAQALFDLPALPPKDNPNVVRLSKNKKENLEEAYQISKTVLADRARSY